MARKRRLRRKQIKEDRLVTTTLTVSTYVQEHFTQVISGIVVLLAAVAIIIFTSQARRNTARAADRELSLAMGQYQLGDKDLAGTTFASLADRYSGHESGVLALYFLGQCNLDRIRWEEALSAFERFLDKVGPDHEFWVAAEMGRAYANEGLRNFAEAAQIMDNLSEAMDASDARYQDVLFNAGSLYRLAGDTNKAIDFYDRAAAMDGPLKSRAEVWVTVLKP